MPFLNSRKDSPASTPTPRQDVMSPDTTGMGSPFTIPPLNLPLPLNLPHLPNLSGLGLPLPMAGIPQIPVPPDLTRFMNMLSGAGTVVGATPRPDGRESSSSTGSSRSSSAGVVQQSSSSHSTPAPTQLRAPPSASLWGPGHAKQTSISAGIKRKKEPDNYVPDGSTDMSRATLPVRRSLRPRAERSYAESPDIVVDYEDEPPTKINGNGAAVNGCDDEESDSDCGEMPPLPIMKVERQNQYKYLKHLKCAVIIIVLIIAVTIYSDFKELTADEIDDRERNLRKLKQRLRSEEMKLVLLKKLLQSQQMKENVCVPPAIASAGGSNTTPNSAVASPKGASLNSSMPQPANAHNQQSLTHQQQGNHNHLHNLQNLQNLQNLSNISGLHPQALQIPGMKGRVSPKLSSNSNGGSSRGGDPGLNLSHLGMSGLFANPHLATLGPIPGLLPSTSASHSSSRKSQQNNLQNSSKNMSSAKVSTLLKGVSQFMLFYEAGTT